MSDCLEVAELLATAEKKDASTRTLGDTRRDDVFGTSVRAIPLLSTGNFSFNDVLVSHCAVGSVPETEYGISFLIIPSAAGGINSIEATLTPLNAV